MRHRKRQGDTETKGFGDTRGSKPRHTKTEGRGTQRGDESGRRRNRKRRENLRNRSRGEIARQPQKEAGDALRGSGGSRQP